MFGSLSFIVVTAMPGDIMTTPMRCQFAMGNDRLLYPRLGRGGRGRLGGGPGQGGSCEGRWEGMVKCMWAVVRFGVELRLMSVMSCGVMRQARIYISDG